MSRTWHPQSWKEKTALFQPVYEDEIRYGQVLSRIAGYPPLVFPGEIEMLKQQLVSASRGDAFVLQGGDCVELFDECREEVIMNKIKIILQMSVILTHALGKPVVRIGRIAGQYFKPRSKETEPAAGGEVLTYRGDALHRFEKTSRGRNPDPSRLVDAFFHASVTLNYIRSLIDGGFADLHHPYKWNLHAIEQSDRWSEYRDIVDRILDAIHFMEAFGGVNNESLNRAEFYISHEGLHLGYESALTKIDKQTGKYYNLGAHMLWIGERTRSPEGAHAEYFRGIANPVGIKIGPEINPAELLTLIELLNPSNEAGKIVLIPRMGPDGAEAVIPGIIENLKSAGFRYIWICDPMHGNNVLTADMIKTRSFDDILREIEAAFRVLRKGHEIFAGVHFEMTGEDVTECIGGAVNLRDTDLSRNYTSYCDPRLNYAQSLEMAFRIARLLGGEKNNVDNP